MYFLIYFDAQIIFNFLLEFEKPGDTKTKHTDLQKSSHGKAISYLNGRKSPLGEVRGRQDY